MLYQNTKKKVTRKVKTLNCKYSQSSQKLFKSIFEYFACHWLLLGNLGGKTSHWYICTSLTVLNL